MASSGRSASNRNVRSGMSDTVSPETENAREVARLAVSERFVRRLVFEPNALPLWELTKKRLQASLAEALAGEVDARTLTVEVGAPPGNPEQLLIRIAYELSAVRKTESHTFQVSAAPGGAP